MKKIKDHEYYVTKDGKVISARTGKEMCQWIDNVGYKQCNLYKDGKKKYVRVHRLIAEAFIPNPLNLPQINHKDGNKLNNNVDNLEWCDNSRNTKHAFDNNLTSLKPVACRIDGIDYKSIREASKLTGLNRKILTNILYNNKKNNYGVKIELLKV